MYLLGAPQIRDVDERDASTQAQEYEHEAAYCAELGLVEEGQHADNEADGARDSNETQIEHP